MRRAAVDLVPCAMAGTLAGRVENLDIKINILGWSRGSDDDRPGPAPDRIPHLGPDHRPGPAAGRAPARFPGHRPHLAPPRARARRGRLPRRRAVHPRLRSERPPLRRQLPRPGPDERCARAARSARRRRARRTHRARLGRHHGQRRRRPRRQPVPPRRVDGGPAVLGDEPHPRIGRAVGEDPAAAGDDELVHRLQPAPRPPRALLRQAGRPPVAPVVARVRRPGGPRPPRRLASDHRAKGRGDRLLPRERPSLAAAARATAISGRR